MLDGGRRKLESKAAGAVFEAARQQHRQGVLNALAEVERTSRQLQATQDTLQYLDEAVAQAVIVRERSGNRFTEGISGLDPVLDAEQALDPLQRQLATTRTNAWRQLSAAGSLHWRFGGVFVLLIQNEPNIGHVTAGFAVRFGGPINTLNGEPNAFDDRLFDDRVRICFRTDAGLDHCGPSQSSLDACLTAIDITDCQSGAINGSLEFGIDQSTGNVKIDNFSLTVGQIDWTLDAGFLGGVDATLQNGATANYAGTTNGAFLWRELHISSGPFQSERHRGLQRVRHCWNHYWLRIGSGGHFRIHRNLGLVLNQWWAATVSVSIPIDYLFDLSGNEVLIQGGITVVASGTLPPPPPPCPADLNNDGEVGFADLSVILSAWEESDAGDANGDGQTNFSDLSAVLSAWGSDC